MDFVLAAEAGAVGGETGGYWQLALILAAIGFLGLFARWRKARMPVIPGTKEFRERDAEPNRYRDAADKALVELLETSRVLNAQVDAKIRVLNRLVKDAEEQSSRLEKLLAEAKGLPDDDVRTARRGSGGGGTKTGAGADSTAGAIAMNIGAGGGAANASGSPGLKFLSELHERVYHLKNEGMELAEIARATSLSTNEVEFMIGTFQENRREGT